MVKSTRSKARGSKARGSKARGSKARGTSRRVFVRRMDSLPSQLMLLREVVDTYDPFNEHSMRRAARTALRGPGEYAVLGPHGSPRGYLDTYEDAWDRAKHGDAYGDETRSEPAYGIFKADSKKRKHRKRRTRRKGRRGGKGSSKGEPPMREAARVRRYLGPSRKRSRSPSSSEKRRTRRRHDKDDTILAAMRRLKIGGVGIAQRDAQYESWYNKRYFGPPTPPQPSRNALGRRVSPGSKTKGQPCIMDRDCKGDMKCKWEEARQDMVCV